MAKFCKLNIVDAVAAEVKVLELRKAFEYLCHFLGAHHFVPVTKEQLAGAKLETAKLLELREVLLHIVEAFDLHPVL